MFIPHTDKERQEMLRTIGKGSIKDLFADIPEPERFPVLDLPESISEMEAYKQMNLLADANNSCEEMINFLGAGAYHHYIPAAVDLLLQRGDFFTAYTPYQPEISQGTLQAIFEFQSLMANLTGMEVSNASHYDGATAAAETCISAYYHFRKKRGNIILSPFIHPHYLKTIKTYLQAISDIEIRIPDISKPTDFKDSIRQFVDNETALVMVQYPDFLGNILDYSAVSSFVHENGALFSTIVYPIALGILKSPADMGADFIVGEGQSLGLPLNFGGPYLGFFTTRKELIRKISGRIVGETEDEEGNRGYVLTLTTREQHIRRGKAISNICTNQGLNALAASIYLSLLGKRGLKEVAYQCYQKAHYTASQIEKIKGFKVLNEQPFFNEFVIQCPCDIKEIQNNLLEKGIFAGYNLESDYPSRKNQLLIAATEQNTREDIDFFINSLQEATNV
jgi:glycine dehydrogenase subunit 1